MPLCCAMPLFAFATLMLPLQRHDDTPRHATLAAHDMPLRHAIFRRTPATFFCYAPLMRYCCRHATLRYGAMLIFRYADVSHYAYDAAATRSLMPMSHDAALLRRHYFDWRSPCRDITPLKRSISPVAICIVTTPSPLRFSLLLQWYTLRYAYIPLLIYATLMPPRALRC